MATMQPAPCAEKLKLRDAFKAACRDIVEIHEAEMAALVAGQMLERSDVALNRARQKRNQAKKALLHHTSIHGGD